MLSAVLLLACGVRLGIAKEAPFFEVAEESEPRRCSHSWCDPGPVESRLEDLVARLTVEEKILQLSNDLFGGVPSVERLGLGGYNYIKEAAHGLLLRGSTPEPTSFPQVVTMAASFNRSLFKSVGQAVGREARFLRETGLRYGDWKGRLTGLLLQFNINIFRDPRWGRGQETPGEDPYLSAQFAASYVSGIQSLVGDGIPQAAASCKHFAAYSFEGGPTQLNKTEHMRDFIPGASNVSRHNENAVVSPQDLTESYFPAFEACARAGALGSMCAYNQVNGIPSCASSELLRSKLREEWGFRGMIVTDCDSIADMYSLQRYRDTPAENIEAALAAGTDVACSPGFFRDYANASMEPLLTEAVKNALRVRFILGEFDPPPADIPDSWQKASAGHVELAMEAALQGAVLLKNEGHMLPLSVEQRVAVLGPLRNATRSILGNYEAWPVPVVTPLAGLKKFGRHVEAPGPEVDICGTAGSSMPEKPDAEVVVVVAGLTADDLEVQDPDVRPVQSEFCKAGCLETEGCDRPNISWPRSQADLIATAATWGTPVVLVVISGGPVDLADYAQMDGIHSILWLGYSGEAAGEALGRLVYGLASPSGRLSQTFYRKKYTAHVAMQDYSFRPRTEDGYPGRGYRFVSDRWIVYPFGHGLSFDSFSFDWLADHAFAGRCQVGVRVQPLYSEALKTRSSSTSVLLFLVPPSGKSGLLKKLVDFQKVEFPPAQSQEDRWKDLYFELSPSDIELVDEAGASSVAGGTWTLQVNEPPELRYSAKVPPVEAREADIDGWTFFARFSGALWETFIDVATSRGPREQKGWEYRKGIEGMSMGSMAFEMMTTSEDTEEFKELSKEYQSGYGVPFLNLSFRKITAATRDGWESLGQQRRVFVHEMRMLSGSVRMARCKLGVSGVLCELASVAFATGAKVSKAGWTSLPRSSIRIRSGHHAVAAAMAGGDDSLSLDALEQRLIALKADVANQRIPKLAAEDEGTKILLAADNLQLQGDGRGRRRRLVQEISLLLDPPEEFSAALVSTTRTEPSCAGRSSAVIDDLLSAAGHLLAEMHWLCRLTQEAIANQEDAYLFSVIPRLPDLEEVQLVRKLRSWASSPPPSHARECQMVVKRIDDLSKEVQAALEALSQPAESYAFCQKACAVYSDLLSCIEAEARKTELKESYLELLQRLQAERQEVKKDIAFAKERLKSLRARYRILRCLAPSREEAQQMNARELRLCLHIHKVPQLSGLMDKQDIIEALVSSGVILA
ncbi:Beta-xylosidase/alpha-L-arabinofuranosidase 2 [Symbiodinium microadriaticum]|uniref:Beta-xylosidase/alpha-L-arabinofuranosidase 2 n=1 Tax=Symbiodinium microadriaticum TaxID=2951 RepID=A0A1Q9EWJ9_SYMMI|nr:Beta-xylosidase/alpha-L-arabinofuranosidase 2 [Symbiodinium microadriaticum]CAE7837737.1 Xyl2 [Symbiodinium microadriaticum]